jgi:hypothetical protein
MPYKAPGSVALLHPALACPVCGESVGRTPALGCAQCTCSPLHPACDRRARDDKVPVVCAASGELRGRRHASGGGSEGDRGPSGGAPSRCGCVAEGPRMLAGAGPVAQSGGSREVKGSSGADGNPAGQQAEVRWGRGR